MEKQQVQLTRMVFVDEIPEEVERLFRKSASSFSHSISEPLIELTNLLEQKNYTLFLEKLKEFREGLAKADLLLEDCDGIVKSYVSLTTQNNKEQRELVDHGPQLAESDGQDIDIQALVKNMQAQAENMQKHMESKDV